MSITEQAVRASLTPFIHGFKYTNELVSCISKLNHLGFNETGLAMLVAQCGHESGGFVYTEENLNYRAKSLMRVWPKRFKTLNVARKFERKPKLIANRVYNGRMGNRDGSDDGWNYRGRGFIQLTGYANYLLYNRVVSEDIVSHPELSKKPLVAWEIAIAYFDFTVRRNKDIIEYANNGDLKTVTRMINGGYHGIKDRGNRFKLALEAIRKHTKDVVSVIKEGDKGPLVVKIQKALGIKNADGIFGPYTKRRLISFQRRRNMCPDGMAGPLTIKALGIS